MGVVVLHVFLVWGLASGFAMKVVESIAPPIVTDLIEEKTEEEAPPPPPPPKMELPPVEVPPPVVDIQIPVEATTTALSNVTDKPLPPPPPPVVVARPVARVAPNLNKRAQQPDTEEYYPPSSKRLSEQGSAVVKACIGENGRLTEATVQESSSFPRLDEAAVKYAKALRYTAGTEDGKPVAACFPFRVTFKLRD
jgi:protein TonB